MTWSAPINLRGPKGAALITGDGAPTADIGGLGDTYLNLITGDLYSPKGAGGWGSAVRNIIGPAGGAGQQGVRGASLLSGYSPPADADGSEGDSYFCQQQGAVFGPKAGGKWPATPTSLIGPPGAGGSQGTIIYPVSDVPSDTMGRDGDFAIDTVGSRLYGPKFGTWGNAASLVGPQGRQGEVGPRGLAGATLLPQDGAPNATVGQVGDYWLDRTGAVLYGPKTADPNDPWPSSGTALRGDMGPEGPRGPAGFMGQSGRSFIIASTDPTAGDGTDGDTWFNKASGYIYGPKKAGAWDLTTGDLIQGAPGIRGEAGPEGPRGPSGVGFLTGQDAPADSLGETGQYYFAAKTLTVYGPKNATSGVIWGNGQSVVGPKGDQGIAGPASTTPGPTGPRGAAIFLLASQPQNSFGSDGDGAITQSGAVYGPKSGGAWGASVGSLIGPKGDKGDVGPAGNASTVAGPAGASLLTGSGKPSSTYGSDGDSFFDQDARAIYVNKTGGAWPASAVSLVGSTGAKGDVGAAGKDGANGTTLRYGDGAPKAATVALDGDFYIDQTNSRLYGPRTNGAWASTYVPLIGPTGQPGQTGSAGTPGKDGATIRSGTGAPSSTNPSTQHDGDYFFATDTTTLYGPRASGDWGAGTSLRGLTGSSGSKGDTGSPGAAGLSVLTGTGAPASTLGAVGQAYIDTSAYVAYVKSSSGWSTGTSLVGPQGTKGDVGSAGPKGDPGPNGAVIYSGSGAPSSTSPGGTIVAGSFYIQTDVTPNRLFGPYSAANGWPTSYVAMGGGSLLTNAGPPANSVGSVGDCAVDNTNAFFYPAKTTNGWTTSPINLVGPQGVPGFSTLNSQSAGNGITCAMSGYTLSATPAAAYIPGTTQPAAYVPPFATQCVGYSCTNPGSAFTIALTNTTTGASVASVSIAANTTVGASFALGTYPMPANQNYQWLVSGSGTASFAFTPIYLNPSVSPGFNISNTPTVGYSPSTTFSSTALQLRYPGTTVGNCFACIKGAAFYSGFLSNLSSASMTFILNVRAGSGGSASTLYSTTVAANTQVAVGPFSTTAYPMSSGTQFYWTVTGSGTGTCFADTQILYIG